MSDYWFNAFFTMAERYASAKDAIKILRKDNGKLKKIPTREEQQRIEIIRLKDKVTAQKAEINFLLANTVCKKIWFSRQEEANLFARFLGERTLDRFISYPCPKTEGLDTTHYHITHKDRSKRGLFRA